jgi:hypothetical protein
MAQRYKDDLHREGAQAQSFAKIFFVSFASMWFCGEKTKHK